MNRSNDETSEALLAAAHRLLADIGPDALTVRRIATEAGMSTMNVYSRFGGKDGVIDELYVDGFTRLRTALEALPQTDDAAADIRALATEYRAFALANPHSYDIMFSRSIPGFRPSTDAANMSLDALTRMAERVAFAQENGQIAIHTGSDPIQITAWLWATFHGMVSLELEGLGDEIVEWKSVFENGIDFAVKGLHPSAHTAKTP